MTTTKKKHAVKKKQSTNKKKAITKKKAVAVPKNTNKKVSTRSPRAVSKVHAKKSSRTTGPVKKKAPAKKKATPKTLSITKATDERYKTFAYEYISNNFNGKQAAIKAGYSEKSAEQQGSRLLRHAKVKGYLAKFIEEREERQKIDADWLLKRLADEAVADMADLYNKDGGLKPVHEWPEIWRTGLVAGMDVEQQYINIDGNKEADGVITKIKLSDRTKRLEMIGKHIDVLAFLKQVEVTENLGLAERLRRSRDRSQGKRGNETSD